MTVLAPKIGAALVSSKTARLAEAEQRIEHELSRVRRSFVVIGLTLREIRDAGLHRDGYTTFESYLADRWGFSRSRAYRLIDAAAVAAVASPMGDIPNERQARELAPLRDEPEQLRRAWEEASANGAPTAVVVREVVERRRGVPNGIPARKVRAALGLLSALAGRPVPVELHEALSDDERAKLAAVLDALAKESPRT